MSKNYQMEIKNKWGNTESYKEFSTKTKDYSKEKWDTISKNLMNIFNSFSIYLLNKKDPSSQEVQENVETLKTFISNNYYTCTNEILFSLGKMYVEDERFKNNIDKEIKGSAEYIRKAIEIYCLK